MALQDDPELARPIYHGDGSSKLRENGEKYDIIVDNSVLALAFPDSTKSWLDSKEVKNCRWYTTWLHERLEDIPVALSSKLRSFSKIFEEVALRAKASDSLATIAEGLLQHDLIDPDPTNDAHDVAVAITFALLGWQSMLYHAELSDQRLGQIAIADILDGYRSTTFFRLQLNKAEIQRPLSDLLLGFGLMLPQGNVCVSDDPEDIEAFDKIAVVTPGGFNASVLTSVAHLKIKWVDAIAPHLELDKATNTVFLFRWPSFCLANSADPEEHMPTSVIYSLASKDDDSSQWASQSDVQQLLREIVLSYRVLFGQDRMSRKLFRSLTSAKGQSLRKDDELLYNLCGTQAIPDVSICKDREVYRLSRDFPILRQRMAILQHQLVNVKPRGWRAIWRDRRDSVQWYTFWAVIMIGGTGLLLGVIQTIFQALQTFAKG